MIETAKKYKNKIVQGSGLAALIGTVTVTGLQYHENVALVESNKSTQHALTVMAERYERLVNECLDRVDEN